MDFLADGLLHTINVVVGNLHMVVEGGVTNDQVLAPLLTSVVAGAIIAIPVTVVFMAGYLALRWAFAACCGRSGSGSGGTDATVRRIDTPAAVPGGGSSGGGSMSVVRRRRPGWCAKAQVTVLLCVGDDTVARRLVVDKRRDSTIAALKVAIMQRLVAAGGAEEGAKLTRILLLPDLLMDDDGDIALLQDGDVLVVGVKA